MGYSGLDTSRSGPRQYNQAWGHLQGYSDGVVAVTPSFAGRWPRDHLKEMCVGTCWLSQLGRKHAAGLYQVEAGTLPDVPPCPDGPGSREASVPNVHSVTTGKPCAVG